MCMLSRWKETCFICFYLEDRKLNFCLNLEVLLGFFHGHATFSLHYVGLLTCKTFSWLIPLQTSHIFE